MKFVGYMFVIDNENFMEIIRLQTFVNDYT